MNDTYIRHTVTVYIHFVSAVFGSIAYDLMYTFNIFDSEQ